MRSVPNRLNFKNKVDIGATTIGSEDPSGAFPLSSRLLAARLFSQAYNVAIWRTSCEVPLILPITLQPLLPLCLSTPSARRPEVQADGKVTKIDSHIRVSDLAGYDRVLRNLSAYAVHHLHNAE
jgi:hypothetical protein